MFTLTWKLSLPIFYVPHPTEGGERSEQLGGCLAVSYAYTITVTYTQTHLHSACTAGTCMNMGSDAITSTLKSTTSTHTGTNKADGLILFSLSGCSGLEISIGHRLPFSRLHTSMSLEHWAVP